MQKEEIRTLLRHEPFVPLQVRLTDGRKLDIPFQHVAIMMTQHLMIMKGVKSPTSRQATGYECVGYDYIERIEPRKRPPRKKAG